ncbi:hypothetical protein [Microbulbifer sp. TYP-18]|uniref:hypothetical protein n=1 Tax=Microbulbifer sp. TYP-18 TaxID=3230024 RepID=UPI0034C5FAD2
MYKYLECLAVDKKNICKAINEFREKIEKNDFSIRKLKFARYSALKSIEQMLTEDEFKPEIINSYYQLISSKEVSIRKIQMEKDINLNEMDSNLQKLLVLNCKMDELGKKIKELHRKLNLSYSARELQEVTDRHAANVIMSLY